jgi:hypothetical protein
VSVIDIRYPSVETPVQMGWWRICDDESAAAE